MPEQNQRFFQYDCEKGKYCDDRNIGGHGREYVMDACLLRRSFLGAFSCTKSLAAAFSGALMLSAANVFRIPGMFSGGLLVAFREYGVCLERTAEPR